MASKHSLFTSVTIGPVSLSYPCAVIELILQLYYNIIIVSHVQIMDETDPKSLRDQRKNQMIMTLRRFLMKCLIWTDIN